MMLTEPQAAAFPVVERLLAGGRGLLFETPTASMPFSRDRTIQGDDRIPQFGYIGDDHTFGGLVIVGVNPANGDRDMRNIWDQQMMPALHAFCEKLEPGTYKQAMHAQLRAFRAWPSTQEIRAQLAFLKIPLEAVAYTNANTYRAGKGRAADVFPTNARRVLAAEHWLRPYLQAVRSPGVVVAYGKAAADVVRIADANINPVVFSRDHVEADRKKENADFVNRLRHALRAVKKG